MNNQKLVLDLIEKAKGLAKEDYHSLDGVKYELGSALSSLSVDVGKLRETKEIWIAYRDKVFPSAISLKLRTGEPVIYNGKDIAAILSKVPTKDKDGNPIKVTHDFEKAVVGTCLMMGGVTKDAAHHIGVYEAAKEVLDIGKSTLMGISQTIKIATEERNR